MIISALGPDKSNIVGMLVRAFGGSRGSSTQIRKVFLDLVDGPRKGDPSAVAEQSGFAAYGVADTTAFTTVETLRLLVGQNVPYSFVRLASGQGMFLKELVTYVIYIPQRDVYEFWMQNVGLTHLDLHPTSTRNVKVYWNESMRDETSGKFTNISIESLEVAYATTHAQ